MAIYQEQYSINISLNGEEFPLSPATYSFDISDSIDTLYPLAQITIDDISGFFQEYLLDVQGQEIGFIYNLKDTDSEMDIKNKFILDYSKLPENQTGFVGGKVTLNLVHEYSHKQTTNSKFFNQSTSGIISDLVSPYFSKTNIKSTNDIDDYYQPNIFDAQFINEYLLPCAYSSNAKDTPYYFFIDNQGKINFTSYYEMLQGKGIVDLQLIPQSIESFHPNQVMSLKKISVGIKQTKANRNRNIFQFDEDGKLNEENDLITDHSPFNKTLPLIADMSLVTNNILFPTCETNLYSGLKNSSVRQSMRLEKFILTTLLNTSLVAGKAINLLIKTAGDPENTELSENYTGKYLIEQSKHSWRGEASAGYTTCVVSRQSLKVSSSNYSIKKRLVSK